MSNSSKTNMFLVNEIMSTKIGKTVYASKEENHRALCKYFVTDSEGEMEFADFLENNKDVLMYSKIKKGSFIIENPIENYSPDWAVVYKIVCAKKHFNAINNDIKYDWINGIEDFKEKVEKFYYYN